MTTAMSSNSLTSFNFGFCGNTMNPPIGPSVSATVKLVVSLNFRKDHLNWQLVKLPI